MNSDETISLHTTNEPAIHAATSDDSCPIYELLHAPLDKMDDAQLAAHVAKLRAARETPNQLRVLMKGKEKAPRKASKPKKVIDINSLF